MARYNALADRINGSPVRVWYNSRPKLRLAEETKFLKHIEIEALPTGGWGYMYFPKNVRFARTFGKQWDASAPPARKQAVDRGNMFLTIPASELATWQKATANLEDEWVRDVTAKGQDGKMLLKAAKDLIRKYETAK